MQILQIQYSTGSVSNRKPQLIFRLEVFLTPYTQHGYFAYIELKIHFLEAFLRPGEQHYKFAQVITGTHHWTPEKYQIYGISLKQGFRCLIGAPTPQSCRISKEYSSEITIQYLEETPVAMLYACRKVSMLTARRWMPNFFSKYDYLQYRDILGLCDTRKEQSKQ